MYKLGYLIGIVINTSFYALFGFDMWRSIHGGRSFALDVLGVVTLLFARQLLMEFKALNNAAEYLALSLSELFMPPQKSKVDEIFDDLTKDL
jgi:hypothetical protein